MISSKVLKFIVVLSVSLWLGGAVAHGYINAPPLSSTGAPALGTFRREQDCTDCHTGALNAGTAEVTLTAAGATYAPNQLVQVTLTAKQAGRVAFGFQGTVLDAQGRSVGQWVVTDPLRTSIETVTVDEFRGRSYIQHTRNGLAATAADTGSWTMSWRAPLQASGRVTFYFVVNVTNNNRAVGGDSIYTRSLTLEPASTLPNATVVSAASYLGNQPLAPQAIATVFGRDFSNSFGGAANLPLPTLLSGVQLFLRDANNVEHLAPLFFVTPQQINFLVPPLVSNGNATLTIRLQDVAVASAAMNVQTVAPALFAANADGKGLAAGVAIRVNAAGAQSYEPLARLNDATQKFEALPLDLGPDGDQLFLALFGSGLRQQTSFACTLGGTSVDVFYAGGQGQFDGLDQVNLRLPRSLAGRGTVTVQCSANGQAANAVTVNVK